MQNEGRGWRYLVCLAFALFYFGFALYYSHERTLFLDNAFQLFRLIQDQGIVINANRWPAAIYRIIPLIAIKAGSSLNLVIVLFSLSYALIPVVCFFILSVLLRHSRAALTFAFLVTVPIAHGFFWCNSELFLALQLSVLGLASLEKGHTFFATMLGCFVAWLHPLSIFIMAFPYGLSAITDKTYWSKRALIPGIAFLINYLTKSLFFKNWYDSIKQQALLDNLKSLGFGDIPDLILGFSNSNTVFMVWVIFGVTLLILKKKFKLLAFATAYFLLTSFVISLSENNGSKFEFYTEVNSYILYFIFAWTISKSVKQKLSNTIFLVLLTCFMAVAGLKWVQHAGYYSNRIEWYRAMASENDRVIFQSWDKELHPLVLEWASAYESLLISSLDGKKSASFIVSSNTDKHKLAGSQDILVTEYKNYPLESLNKRYFRLEKKAYSLKYLD